MERRYCKHLVNGGSVVRRRECKNRAMAGSEYCSLHVNHPARRVEATKASLHDYVDAAIHGLGRIVQAATDDARDVKDADVIKAATAILDRTGHGPTSTVTVQDSDDRLNQILRERRRAMDDSEG